MATSVHDQLHEKTENELTSREIFELKAFVHGYLPKELFGWTGKPFDVAKVQTKTLDAITKKAKQDFHAITDKIRQLEQKNMPSRNSFNTNIPS